MIWRRTSSGSALPRARSPISPAQARALQAVHGKARQVRGRAPWRDEFGAVRNQQQHAAVSEAIDQQVEQLLRRRVDPLRVFDQYAQRLVGGWASRRSCSKARVSALLPAGAASADAASDQAEDRTEQRDGSLCLFGVGEQSGETLAPHRRRIVVGEAGGAFEVTQHRIERAVGMVGRALQTDFGMRLVAMQENIVSQRRDLPSPGSPDSRKSWPSPAAADRPAVQHERKFGVAADKGGGGRVAGGAEAAGVVVGGDHLPGRNTGADALQRQRIDRFEVEQIGDERTGAGGDDDAIAGGDGLQTGREVRGFAEHGKFGGGADRDRIRRRRPRRWQCRYGKRVRALRSARSDGIAATMSSPARTARSASSSCACG